VRRRFDRYGSALCVKMLVLSLVRVFLDLVKFQLFKSSKHNLAFLAFPLIGPRFFIANIRRFLTFILFRLEIIEGMIIVHFVL
jgi:hypothetical protein